MNKAKFIQTITVNDTELSVYQDENGGIFAIDSSYLDQCFDDDTNPIIPNPFADADENSIFPTIMLSDE